MPAGDLHNGDEHNHCDADAASVSTLIVVPEAIDPARLLFSPQSDHCSSLTAHSLQTDSSLSISDGNFCDFCCHKIKPKGHRRSRSGRCDLFTLHTFRFHCRCKRICSAGAECKYSVKLVMELLTQYQLRPEGCGTDCACAAPCWATLVLHLLYTHLH